MRRGGAFRNQLRKCKTSCMVSLGFIFAGLMLAAFLACIATSEGSTTTASRMDIQNAVFPGGKGNDTFLMRKLLLLPPGDSVTDRVGSTCSKDNILIFQGPTSPLPSGIPTYTVEILNACVSGCSISNIHVSCGWFSSARLINPNVFRRVCYDDCLVNNGKPLRPGQSLSFQYANSFRYPLSVSSLVCC